MKVLLNNNETFISYLYIFFSLDSITFIYLNNISALITYVLLNAKLILSFFN